MMGVGPEVFSAWKAEYAELFDKLISIFPDQIDEAIIQDVLMKFSFDRILDTPTDAIRAFYTSPMDALLLNFLIKKSDSPSRRA